MGTKKKKETEKMKQLHTKGRKAFKFDVQSICPYCRINEEKCRLCLKDRKMMFYREAHIKFNEDFYPVKCREIFTKFF